MILVSFSSAGVAWFEDVKRYGTFRSQATENPPFRFLWDTGYRSPQNFFCRWLLALEEYCQVSKVKPFSLEIRNKNITQILFYFLSLLKASVQTRLEEICKFVKCCINSIKFTNFIVCHHELSFHIYLISFKDAKNVLQKCVILPYITKWFIPRLQDKFFLFFNLTMHVLCIPPWWITENVWIVNFTVLACKLWTRVKISMGILYISMKKKSFN